MYCLILVLRLLMAVAPNVSVTVTMAPKQRAKKQGSLLGHCWPKPVSAAGKYADVLGKFWDKCPAADKAKIFKCLVIEFKAIHDFGGVKGAGMLLKDL